MLSSKRFNIEALIKIIILLGFTVFFIFIIQSGKIQLYVHPRIIPYVKFAIIAIIIMIVFLFKDIRRPTGRLDILPYLFFIVPLILAFALPARTIQSGFISLNSTVKSVQGNSNNSSNSMSSDQGLKLENDALILDDDNFVQWLEEIDKNTEKYIDKKVLLTGFVLKDSRFKSNEFVPARKMMSCCAADATSIGLLCRFDKTSELTDNSWVKVNGIIKLSEFDGTKMPVIEAVDVQKTDAPEQPYVYPY